MTNAALRVTFFDRGKRPQCPPNPNFPNGVDADVSGGWKPVCRVDLPKVATVGMSLVVCDPCGENAMITAAGRPDDPRSFTMACAKAPP